MLHAVCFYSVLAAMVAQWFWRLATKPKDTGLIRRDGNVDARGLCTQIWVHIKGPQVVEISGAPIMLCLINPSNCYFITDYCTLYMIW